jgi:sec-independent protein translocase protein TatB
MGTPPPIQMANLGMTDTLIIMVIALVVLGPRRLPQVGRQIGKLMYEFRKASNDFKFQMEEELRNAEEADRRKKEEEERQRALAAAPPAPQIEATTSAPAEPNSASPVESSGTDPVSSAPAPDASISAAPENPYPSEMTVPEVAAETVAPSDPSEPSPTPEPDAAAPVAESATPRIMPPSTGETVAADRPGTQHQQRELFAAEPGKTPESVTPEAERSEPATHHG